MSAGQPWLCPRGAAAIVLGCRFELVLITLYST
jgi:hypothetical protein